MNNYSRDGRSLVNRLDDILKSTIPDILRNSRSGRINAAIRKLVIANQQLLSIRGDIAKIKKRFAAAADALLKGIKPDAINVVNKTYFGKGVFTRRIVVKKYPPIFKMQKVLDDLKSSLEKFKSVLKNLNNKAAANKAAANKEAANKAAANKAAANKAAANKAATNKVETSVNSLKQQVVNLKNQVGNNNSSFKPPSMNNNRANRLQNSISNAVNNIK